MAPKSANGSLYTSARVLSLSNAAHAPLRDRIARHQRTASETAFDTVSGPRFEQREHDHGRVVDVRVDVVVEFERPSAALAHAVP